MLGTGLEAESQRPIPFPGKIIKMNALLLKEKNIPNEFKKNTHTQKTTF